MWLARLMQEGMPVEYVTVKFGKSIEQEFLVHERIKNPNIIEHKEFGKNGILA